MHNACQYWLQTAARCDALTGGWPEHLCRLSEGDRYGAREDLLRRADLLLDEAAQRELVARFDSQLAKYSTHRRRLGEIAATGVELLPLALVASGEIHQIGGNRAAAKLLRRTTVAPYPGTGMLVVYLILRRANCELALATAGCLRSTRIRNAS